MPSVAVCTEVFFAAGKVQARVLGHSDLEPLTVAHPIQSLTPDQIRERAEGAVEEIVARLTKESSVTIGRTLYNTFLFFIQFTLYYVNREETRLLIFCCHLNRKMYQFQGSLARLRSRKDLPGPTACHVAIRKVIITASDSSAESALWGNLSSGPQSLYTVRGSPLSHCIVPLFQRR